MTFHLPVMGSLVAAFDGMALPEHLVEALQAGLGGIVLLARNVESSAQMMELTGTVHDLNPQALVMVDEEGGAVSRLDKISGGGFPSAQALGYIDETELSYDIAASRGKLLRDLGVDLCLGPVADLRHWPENPVVGTRSFGEDPELVARHVDATIRGTRSAGVATCVKHFPGHGVTSTDSHESRAVAQVDEPDLRRLHLTPFKSAVAAGADAVMPAHLVVPAWDQRPASTSPAALGILRSELGFDGPIISDAMDMTGVGTPQHVAVLDTLRAGADLVLLGNQEPDGTALARIVRYVSEEMAHGPEDRDRLEQATDRRNQISRPSPSLGRNRPDRRAEAAERAISWLNEVEERPERIETVLIAPPAWARGLEVQLDVVDSLGTAFPDAEIIVASDDSPPEADLVVTNDSIFYLDQPRLFSQIHARCPGSLVVETGIPSPELSPPAVLLRGASDLNFEALAKVLTGARG